jgi:NAD(P)-dependent dehydrogenase (short-subunit alcohol dehydrogenase family)
MNDRPGRVVVITGGSSGIGRETARQFAKQGASVVLAARGEEALASTAEEVTAAGGTPLVVPTDVADWIRSKPSPPRPWSGSGGSTRG